MESYSLGDLSLSSSESEYENLLQAKEAEIKDLKMKYQKVAEELKIQKLLANKYNEKTVRLKTKLKKAASSEQLKVLQESYDKLHDQYALMLKNVQTKSAEKSKKQDISCAVMRKLIGSLISILKINSHEEILKNVQELVIEKKASANYKAFVYKLTKCYCKVYPLNSPTLTQLYHYSRKLVKEKISKK